MIPDQLLRLADNQAINGESTVVTNAVDLDTVRDIGSGETLYVRVMFNTLYAQVNGGTNVVLVYADNVALDSNAVVLSQLPLNSGAIPPAGSVYYLPIPPIAKAKLTIPGTAKKYFGLQWQIYGETPAVSNGTWTVDIVTETNMCEHTYQKGFTVQ